MSGSLERSLDKALRAYPRRYLASRRGELLDLVHDLAGPDATRLSWRLWLDLAKGGLVVRLRDRPPLPQRLGNHWLGHRLPARWADWVKDDIDSVTFPVRETRTQAALTAFFLVTSGGLSHFSTYILYFLVGLYALVFLVAVARPGQTRRTARKRNGIGPDGVVEEPPFVQPAYYAWAWRTPVRRQIWPVWLGLGSITLLLAPAFAQAISISPMHRSPLHNKAFRIDNDAGVGTLWGPVLLASLGVGVLLFLLARARLRGRLAARQLEPDPQSVLRSQAWLTRFVGAAVCVALLVYVGVWVVTLPSAFGLGLMAAGVALGPYAIFAALVAQGVEQETGVVVTGAELLRATFGRLPLLAPAAGWGFTIPPKAPPTSAV